MCLLKQESSPFRAGRIQDNGSREYYINGVPHRLDGPAIDMTTGLKKWFVHGKLHREHGLPAVKHPDGSQEWYEHGLRHRIDGPAIERFNGVHEWWYLGKQFPTEEYFKKAVLHDRFLSMYPEKHLEKRKKSKIILRFYLKKIT